jgi:hypothetical protein
MPEPWDQERITGLIASLIDLFAAADLDGVPARAGVPSCRVLRAKAEMFCLI